MEDASPRSSSRSWWMLGSALLILLLLTIGGGCWWLYTDNDLEAVRTEARKQGVAATWPEMGLVQADEARLTVWKRIAALSKTLKSYQNGPGLKAGAPPFKLFLPIPDDMRAHHAGLDPLRIDELMGLLDQLGDQPLVLHQAFEYATLLPEISIHRDLVRLLQERIALAEASDVPRLCRRMLALCRCHSADCLILHLVHTSVVEIALAAVTSRLNDLKHTDPAIAEAVLAATQDLPAQFIHALRGEFLCCMETVSKRGFYNGLGEPSSNWFMPIVIRLGRRGMLNAHLDAIAQLERQDLAGALAWAQANVAAFARAKSGIPNPMLILQGLFAPSYPLTIAMGHRTALRGRLLAAELRGQPWPPDSFDPTGSTLRPFTRDNTLVGAYSVDTDGVDDGGDAKKDRYFPLYGPRDLPKPKP